MAEPPAPFIGLCAVILVVIPNLLICAHQNRQERRKRSRVAGPSPGMVRTELAEGRLPGLHHGFVTGCGCRIGSAGNPCLTGDSCQRKGSFPAPARDDTAGRPRPSCLRVRGRSEAYVRQFPDAYGLPSPFAQATNPESGN